MSLAKDEEYPNEQFLDKFSRKDEIIIQLNESIRTLIQTISGITPAQNLPPVKVKYLMVVTVPLISMSTEYHYQFPVGTKRFDLHTRNGNAVRIATEPGKVAASNDPYFTLKADTAYSSEDLNIIDFSQTFYFACDADGEVVEMILGV